MKTFFALILTAFLSIISLESHAQNILGKWDVSCALEKSGEKSIKVCAVCPIEYSDDKTSIDIQSFGMIFTKDSVSIRTNAGIETVPHILDASLDHIVFTYKDKEHNFAILTLDEVNMLILKDDRGNILHLMRSRN